MDLFRRTENGLMRNLTKELYAKIQRTCSPLEYISSMNIGCILAHAICILAILSLNDCLDFSHNNFLDTNEIVIDIHIYLHQFEYKYGLFFVF